MEKDSTISYLQSQDEKLSSFRCLDSLPSQAIETKTKISENGSENEGFDSRHVIRRQCHSSAEEGGSNLEKTSHIQKDGEQVENTKGVLRQGPLKRSSTSLFRRQEVCYFSLTPQKLQCFQDATRGNLISCLSFQFLCYNIEKENITLRIKRSEKSDPIVLKAENIEEAEAWFRDIKRVIQFNISRKKISIRQSKNHIYEEMDGVTESNFLQMAETGDIILMKTQTTQCAFQRFITHSEYDHVGLLVKFADNKVKIFQANADDGVNIYDWDQFQSSFHCYEKTSFRKLHHSRKSQFQNILLTFIKKTIGREYDLNPLSFFRKQSDDKVEGSKGYFCSQLLAKAYKEMGLLENQKASSNYWPFDFTDRGGLILKQAAYFGPERLIILNKHLKCVP